MTDLHRKKTIGELYEEALKDSIREDLSSLGITVTLYLTPKLCHSLTRHSTHPAWLRA